MSSSRNASARRDLRRGIALGLALAGLMVAATWVAMVGPVWAGMLVFGGPPVLVRLVVGAWATLRKGRAS